jgi:hypothetical protein
MAGISTDIRMAADGKWMIWRQLSLGPFCTGYQVGVISEN